VAAEEIELPVQVNGKLRDLVRVPPGLDRAELEAIVMAQPRVIANLQGKEVVRVIHVGGRLVNIVVR
jgi:leucyl-tRNA synthetase